jgi:hypothetical protein
VIVCFNILEFMLTGTYFKAMNIYIGLRISQFEVNIFWHDWNTVV